MACGRHKQTMPPRRRRRPAIVASSSTTAPTCLILGALLGRCTVQALLTRAPTMPFRGFSRAAASSPSSASRGRACVRPRVSESRLFATAEGGSGNGAGDMDSSEIYEDLRRRLEELRRDRGGGGNSSDNDGVATYEDVSDLGLFQSQEDDDGGGGGGGSAGVKVYSAQEMKQRYYQAFWKARNLHKEVKFEESGGDGQADGDGGSCSSLERAPPTDSSVEAGVASRATILTPMAMNMFRSRGEDLVAPAAAPSTSGNVQGLTQMYYLEEEAEQEAVAAASAASAAVVAASNAAAPAPGTAKQEPSCGRVAGASAVFYSDGVSATDGAGVAEAEPLFAEPQGLTQCFFLDPEKEEEAAAALPVVPRRSFLRERLGVSGEVVQSLRQVELDHARLAMLAVLLSGAVGAGAGAGALMNTHEGFSALAEVARTPWLDPYVAGGILAAKALSEGDWRIGKGAMAGWADQALSSVSNTGARVLRLGSGNEIRRLAVEMEVKHGRLALGAVFWALTQQGVLTSVAA